MNPASEPQRVLVEGGPVHRRVNGLILAVTILLAIVAIGLLWTWSNQQEIKEQRHSSCIAANHRHDRAIPALAGFVATHPDPTRPKLKGKAYEEALAEFVTIFVPHYNCSTYQPDEVSAAH